MEKFFSVFYLMSNKYEGFFTLFDENRTLLLALCELQGFSPFYLFGWVFPEPWVALLHEHTNQLTAEHLGWTFCRINVRTLCSASGFFICAALSSLAFCPENSSCFRFTVPCPQHRETSGLCLDFPTLF